MIHNPEAGDVLIDNCWEELPTAFLLVIAVEEGLCIKVDNDGYFRLQDDTTMFDPKTWCQLND